MALDEGLEAEIEGMLKTARLSYVEQKLFEACETSLVDSQAAKEQINAQVRGFEMANIKASDLHRALWSCASEIVNGESL